MAKKTARAARAVTMTRDGGAGEIPLRVVVVRPPVGVRFGVQRGRGADYDLWPPSAEGRGTPSGAAPSPLPSPARGEGVRAADSVGEDLAFDFSVRVIDGGGAGGAAVRFGGPFVQGPSGGKFVYVCSGTMAGQAGSCWSRRAKVPLGGITAALVREVMKSPGARLEARFEGTGRDGGPTCATVKGIEWRVVRG